MNDRETAAQAELEDVLRRLAGDLLDRDDGPLVTEWTLVLTTVPGDGAPEDGAEVDVIAPETALVTHVLGALRLATLSVEAEALEP